MSDNDKDQIVDALVTFEIWLLNKRSDKHFRLNSPHAAAVLDDACIVHCEVGGIFKLDMNFLEHTGSHRANRSVPSSEIKEINFYDEIPANPPELMKSHSLEFPLRSSLKRGTCPECNGKKEKVCHTCSGGKEKVTCHRCGGKGRIITRLKAWDFDLDGNIGWEGVKMRTSEKVCPKCSGVGNTLCPECGGYGRYSCKKCKGEGMISSYEVVIQAYKFHSQPIKVISENNLTQLVSEEITRKPLTYTAIHSAFDNPFHMANGKIERSLSLKFGKVNFSWPLSLDHFLAEMGADFPGLSRLFEKLQTQYHKTLGRIQRISRSIFLADHSVEFTPVSHLVFSKVKKYDKQYHFALIGTSECFVVLPPRLPQLFLRPDFFIVFSLFIAIEGSIIAIGISGTADASFGIFVVAILVLICASPALYRIPNAMKSLSSSHLTLDKSEKDNTSNRSWKNILTLFKRKNSTEERLVLLTGPDCQEKNIFFCLLNYELCRRREITISDLWIHNMLAILLDAEIPRFGNSHLCNWEILPSKLPDFHKGRSKTRSPTTSEKISKSEKSRRIIHFLDVPASLFRADKQDDKDPVLNALDANIIFIPSQGGIFSENNLVQKIITDVMFFLTKIASIKKSKPIKTPIFIIFDNLERKIIAEIISALEKENIKPFWDIIDVNLMKSQYLEGKFEKYEAFIDKIWDFINMRGSSVKQFNNQMNCLEMRTNKWRL